MILSCAVCRNDPDGVLFWDRGLILGCWGVALLSGMTAQRWTWSISGWTAGPLVVRMP
jgi:hypothetical protein